jgi:adenine-specific DNA methylase
LIGVARKQRALKRAFDVVRGRRGKVEVFSAAAQDWGKLAPKIDYAFVDPPFGANIPYAEANFIAEAWLGEFTDQKDEASISKAQGKSACDYRALLAEGFDALRGRMHRHATMTVMFHSAASEPWTALTGALSQAGFDTESVLLLDKRQGSFKQVKTKGAVEGDLLIEVKPRRTTKSKPARVAPDLAAWLGRTLDPKLLPLDSKTERGLFSRYLAEHVAHGAPVTTSASKFYAAARALAATYPDPSTVP